MNLIISCSHTSEGLILGYFLRFRCISEKAVLYMYKKGYSGPTSTFTCPVCWESEVSGCRTDKKKKKKKKKKWCWYLLLIFIQVNVTMKYRFIPNGVQHIEASHSCLVCSTARIVTLHFSSCTVLNSSPDSFFVTCTTITEKQSTKLIQNLQKENHTSKKWESKT